jgi:hypothetical protein
MAAAVLCGACAAQIVPPGQRGATHPGAWQPAPAKPAAQQQPPAAAAKPMSTSAPETAPASLLNQPPEPARITLSGGKLTVTANNSSLTEILRTIASTGGMNIQGLSRDQRIFGSYGPGNPRKVLGSLLEGTGYNVLMVGSTRSGAPAQLVLTVRGDAPPSPPMPVQATEQMLGPRPNPYQNLNQYREEHPAPQPLGPRPGVQPPNNGKAKSPAQILQELEKMRQQQEQKR